MWGVKGYEFIANGLQVVVIVEGFPFLETGKEGLREYLREKKQEGRTISHGLQLVGFAVDERFWDTDAPIIDHEETVFASPEARMVANLILIPVFITAAVVFPILFTLSVNTKIAVGGFLFGGLPYGFFLFAIYAYYMHLMSDEVLRIDSRSGNITLTVRKHKGKKLNEFEHPMNEVKRVEARESGNEEGGTSISVTIKGKNPLGAPWTLDITRFSSELYRQGKPSMDRRRISVIKTAERFGTLLGVEVVSWVKLPAILPHTLREEFDRDWVKQWAWTPEREKRNRRSLNENEENRQEIQ